MSDDNVSESDLLELCENDLCENDGSSCDELDLVINREELENEENNVDLGKFDFNYKWVDTIPNNFHKRSPADIVKHDAMVSNEMSATNMVDVFKLFFPNSLVQKIVDYTNDYALQHDVFLNTTKDELYAWIGIIVAMGFNKDATTDIKYLWNSDHGRSFYIGAMSRDRFILIKRFLRFDDVSKRQTHH